jgi:hypothetical protein
MEYNYDSFEDDDIRPPDDTKKEQLLTDNRSDYDKEIEQALYLSLKESQEKIKEIEEYEKKIYQDYVDSLNVKRETFKPLLNEMLRVSKFDYEVKHIYDIIEPIIDSYCNQFLPYVEFDEITYNNIFRVINTIRIDKICIEELKKIIFKE